MTASRAGIEWRAIVLLAALGAASWSQRDVLRQVARWAAGTASVCAGPAAAPAWATAIATPSVAFLTSQPDPLRSEQFFCLQYELIPRVLVRPTLAAPGDSVGFGPARPAVVYAETTAARDEIIARLAAEAGGVPPTVRAAGGGWMWLEAGSE